MVAVRARRLGARAAAAFWSVEAFGSKARGAGARAAELARRWDRAVADALQACAQSV